MGIVYFRVGVGSRIDEPAYSFSLLIYQMFWGIHQPVKDNVLQFCTRHKLYFETRRTLEIIHKVTFPDLKPRTPIMKEMSKSPA